jgi:hypothetical protein
MTNQIVYTVPDELLNEDIYSTIRSDLQKYWTPKAEAPKELTQLPTDQQLTKEQIDLLKAYQQFVVNLANELKNVGKFGSIGLGMSNNRIKALLQQIVVLFQNVNVIAQQTQIKINEAKKITRKVAPNAEIVVDISGLFKNFQINNNKKEQFINTLKNIINDIMKGIKTELQFFINVDKEEPTEPTQEQPESKQKTITSQQALEKLKDNIFLHMKVESIPSNSEAYKQLDLLRRSIINKLGEQAPNEAQIINITLNEAKRAKVQTTKASSQKPKNKNNNPVTIQPSQPVTQPTVVQNQQSNNSEETQQINQNQIFNIDLDLTKAFQEYEELSKYKDVIINELENVIKQTNQEIEFKFTVKNSLQQQNIKLPELTPDQKKETEEQIRRANIQGVKISSEQYLELLGFVFNVAGFAGYFATGGVSAAIGAMPDIILAIMNLRKRSYFTALYNLASAIPGAGAFIKGGKLILSGFSAKPVIGAIIINILAFILRYVPRGDVIFNAIKKRIEDKYGKLPDQELSEQILKESKKQLNSILTETQIKRWQTLANI